jgi:hypothetical protein
MPRLKNFTTESLGIYDPQAFPGFGTSHTDFDHCVYGIGDTEAEALDDCLDLMACSAEFDFTDEIEKSIKAEFGEIDDTTTVADSLCWEGEHDGDEETGENYFHVGIRWNE